MGRWDIKSAKTIYVITFFLVFGSNVFAQSSVGKRLLDQETNEDDRITAKLLFEQSMPVPHTNQDDLNGLKNIIGNFSRLKSWKGDPCLPSNTKWDWLKCNTDDSPRVILLNLSNYNLEGPIPDFSQMQALEIINLNHNQLNGKVPDFFGKLSNLTLLNLSFNNLDTTDTSPLTNATAVYDLVNNQKYQSNGDSYYTYAYWSIFKYFLWFLLAIPLSIAIWWFLFRKHLYEETTVVTPPVHGPIHVVELGHVEHETVTETVAVGVPVRNNPTRFEYVEYEHTTVSMR